MRIAFLLAALGVTSVAKAQASPPTASFELLPPEEEAPPVADDSRSEPPTVPKQEWVPLSSSTDYRGGFDRPWPSEAEVERRWYGWQTLSSDALSIGLMAFAVNGDGSAAAGVGVLGYVLGAPLIHAAHGHAGKALGSVGLRVGAPIAGAFLGLGAADCEHSNDEDGDDYCGLEAAAEGFLLGAAAAMIVDAAVIANEDVEPARAPTREGVTLHPDVRIAKDRAQLSLSGSF